MTLFDQALDRANASGKVLLVSFGAEWCIWCHVFDEHLSGEYGRMNYQYANPGDSFYEEITLNESTSFFRRMGRDRIEQAAAD